MVERPSSGLVKEYTGNYRDNVNILICKVTNTTTQWSKGGRRHIGDSFLFQMGE